MVNECIPYWEPGGSLPAKCNVAIIGCRFVAIAGNRTSGPGLSATADGSVPLIGYPAAAGRVFGVAKYDGAQGDIIGVYRTPAMVLPVLAAGAIAAFEEVKVDAVGRVVTLGGAGVPVGYAISAAANGEFAQVSLY